MGIDFTELCGIVRNYGKLWKIVEYNGNDASARNNFLERFIINCGNL